MAFSEAEIQALRSHRTRVETSWEQTKITTDEITYADILEHVKIRLDVLRDPPGRLRPDAGEKSFAMLRTDFLRLGDVVKRSLWGDLREESDPIVAIEHLCEILKDVDRRSIPPILGSMGETQSDYESDLPCKSSFVSGGNGSTGIRIDTESRQLVFPNGDRVRLPSESTRQIQILRAFEAAGWKPTLNPFEGKDAKYTCRNAINDMNKRGSKFSIVGLSFAFLAPYTTISCTWRPPQNSSNVHS